ncbi:hypothetical protein DM02DRAFT_598544 [Periconia macrospinosa]|uniref:Uncharacterized protein n=1 Tax=Periconia macrospinosa TaxID=97972 RepID=A0A2V1DFG4_9PLEO|nr:hypothetical protein DM02DRAFT_598544 [Periconia macrospinosa]
MANVLGKDIHQKFLDLESTQRQRIFLGQQEEQGDSEQGSWSGCGWDGAIIRNRYANVVPYEKNRVNLNVPEGTNDYINASPITLRTTKSKTVLNYIATQGPKSDTVPHFWRMVWHETSPAVIIMLTRLWESDREKCYPYYPRSLDAPDMEINSNDEYGDGFVPNIRLVNLDDYEEDRTLVREMYMTLTTENGSESRKIWHLQFGGWPDFLVPEGRDREALLRLIEVSREKSNETPTNPRIIHCSAGVGRTGVFIALDWLLQELEEGSLDEVEDDNDPVMTLVDTLRQQRMMMVQGEAQLAFIYDVLREKWRERWIKLHPEKAERSGSTNSGPEEAERLGATNSGLEEPALHVAERINLNSGIFNYNKGPLQGSERLWYCGSCGDGPIGVWNPVCVTCGHKRDDCCTLSELLLSK